MRVLCVDDDRINALLLGEVCRAVGGIDVTFAESAAEAIELVGQCAPELLVVDLHLPDGDGLSLLPRLRAAAGRVGLPAVLCTAELPADVAPHAMAAGYDECWPKPVELDALRSALQRLAAATTARSELADPAGAAPFP